MTAPNRHGLSLALPTAGTAIRTARRRAGRLVHGPRTRGRAARGLLLLLLLTGCAAPPGPAAAARDSVAIDSLYIEFRAAYATLDADRVTAIYAPGALYGSPDAPGFETGQTPIRSSFAGFFAAMARDSARLEIRFRFVGRFRSPTLASDVGYYWLRRVKGDSAGTPSVGKFTTVLAPDSSGRWRFLVDSYSGAALASFDSAPPFEP